jgi:thiol-disulfide isomerase/thioredoxin
VSMKWVFTIVGALAMLAGTSLWLGSRATAPATVSAISPAALFAAGFEDSGGRRHSLGEFQGKVLVLNFWATWCAPCRDEMPAFNRVHSRWAGRDVQFVGLSAESGEQVAAFGRSLGVNYPLWTGGDGVSELSRRLGNRLGVLPHTVIVNREGRVLDMKVGPYTEAELESRLSVFSAK